MEQVIIGVMHPKGGTGKTATTINASIGLAEKLGYDVVSIFDLDKQKQMTKFANNRERNGLKKLNVIDFKDDEDFKEKLQNQKGIVLIDTGGFDSSSNRLVALVSDLIILPLNNSDQEIDGLRDFQMNLKEVFDVNENLKCKVLVNRVHFNDNSTQKAFEEYLSNFDNFSTFNTSIPHNKAFGSLLSTGMSVSEMDLDSIHLKLRINKFINELEEEINNG